MRATLRALGDFVRGFLGLTAPPADVDQARAQLVEQAERRPRCC